MVRKVTSSVKENDFSLLVKRFSKIGLDFPECSVETFLSALVFFCANTFHKGELSHEKFKEEMESAVEFYKQLWDKEHL